MWRGEAAAAIASMRARFRRADGPGFAFSGDGNEKLLVNGRDLFDKATPSASGAAAWALARLALKTGDRELAREARDAVEEVSWLMARSPHGTESWFFALETLLEFEDNTVCSLARPPAKKTSCRSLPLQAPREARSGVTDFLDAEDPGRLAYPGARRTPDRSVGGSDFTFEEISLPPPTRLPDSTRDDETGWFGTLEANLSFFSLSPSATRGTTRREREGALPPAATRRPSRAAAP